MCVDLAVAEVGAHQPCLVSSLHLLDVDASDAGEYRCTADNPAGRAEMIYTVVITSVAQLNRSTSRDDHSGMSSADDRARRTVHIAVLIGSATVAVIAAGVAGCAVAIRLRTATIYHADDVHVRPSATTKSVKLLRRSLTVTSDRQGSCSTSIVGGATSTRQAGSSTGRPPVSVAWADCALSPIDDDDQRQQRLTTNVGQHQFHMTIFPAACCSND